MPYKRTFHNKVRRVLRDETETKRVVQTKQNCKQFTNTQGRKQLYGAGINADPTTSGAETDYCWSIGHNQFQVWPVALIHSERGLGAGYEVQTSQNPGALADAQAKQFQIRVGSEIWCKGISLKMMWSLHPVVPYCAMKIMLVRSKKGDCPRDNTQPSGSVSTTNDSNFYMGYSQNSLLDMYNTRRHKILKTWTRTFRQHQSTTMRAGQNVNADGMVVHPKGTAALPEASHIKVLHDAQGKTKDQWEAYILLNYPDWRGFTRGDSYGSSSSYNNQLQQIMDAGFNNEESVLLHRYSDTDIISGQASSQEWDVFNETAGHNTYTYIQKHDVGTWTTTPSGVANQVVIVKKVANNDGENAMMTDDFYGGGYPIDQVQFEHQKIIDLWIPGTMFGRGGNITYDAKGSTDELAGDFEYNLLFQTYANAKSWTWHGTGSSEPIMLELSDFQQIMYCKDL